jgi:cell cycle arrest protein BUB3
LQACVDHKLTSFSVAAALLFHSLQVSAYPSSVASLAFNTQGDLLAVASSYGFEYGQREAPPDSIFIRPVQESEVKPKPRKTAAPQ